MDGLLFLGSFLRCWCNMLMYIIKRRILLQSMGFSLAPILSKGEDSTCQRERSLDLTGFIVCESRSMLLMKSSNFNSKGVTMKALFKQTAMALHS